MPTTPWDYVLWAAILVAEGWVLGILLGRGAYRRMPVFTAYVGLKIVRSLFLFYSVLWCSPAVYFYRYWAATLFAYLIVFPVIYEVFDFTCRSYRLCLLVVLLGSLALLLAEPVNTQYWLIATVRGVEKVFWLTFAGLFLWAVTVEPPISRERYGVALGLAVFGLASLVKATSISHFNFTYIEYFKRIPAVLYPVTLLIWLRYLRAGRGDCFETSSSTLYRLAMVLEGTEAEVEGSR